MFWKLLTLAIILAFAWWRIWQFLHARRLRAQGLPEPKSSIRFRPITLLALGLLAVYGGYLLFFVLKQIWLTLASSPV